MRTDRQRADAERRPTPAHRHRGERRAGISKHDSAARSRPRNPSRQHSRIPVARRHRRRHQQDRARGRQNGARKHKSRQRRRRQCGNGPQPSSHLEREYTVSSTTRPEVGQNFILLVEEGTKLPSNPQALPSSSLSSRLGCTNITCGATMSFGQFRRVPVKRKAPRCKETPSQNESRVVVCGLPARLPPFARDGSRSLRSLGQKVRLRQVIACGDLPCGVLAARRAGLTVVHVPSDGQPADADIEVKQPGGAR